MAAELYLPLHTDLTDLSPYGRNGSSIGATFVANSGKRKGSYYFNNSLTNRITTPAFAFVTPNQMTYSFWSKSVQSARTSTALNKAVQSATTAYIRITRYTSSDSLYFYFCTGSVAQAFTTTNYFTGLDNKWIHTVVTVDTVAGQISIYKNGYLVRQSSPGLSILPITASSAVVVGDYQGTSNSWAGNICEVKVVPGIWNPAQVKDEYMLLAGQFNN